MGLPLYVLLDLRNVLEGGAQVGQQFAVLLEHILGLVSRSCIRFLAWRMWKT